MKLRTYTAAVALTAALILTGPTDVNAASMTTSTLTASIAGVSLSSSETRVSGDNIRFAQVLSSNYNRTVSPAEVIRLKTDFDFGFGDISLVYAAANYSGRSIDEISRSRYGNMGWGEIAKLYGVKVKDLKKGNDDVIRVAQNRGIDVNYIEIEDRDDQGHNNNNHNNHKKDNKHEEKSENSKGHGHKK